ncbi:MAG: DUF92 domain-containing protein [Chloroflexota bacterium]|nr:DUF92 domain-containing protein [Chloroflexota bacterium]
MQFIIGLLIATLISYIAYKVDSLNKSGAFAAAIMGTIIFGIGGWQWSILLVTFFTTSSALSRAFKKTKLGLNEKFSKGNARDAGQVFGNGGVATIFVLLNALYPESTFSWVGFAASLAAVNADTWATELGVLNPTPPRIITDIRKRVEKGTSGGVSLYGIFASLLGSAIIALLAVLLSPTHSLNTDHFLLITASGLAASLFDSFLGATVQAMYFCPTDKKETEKHPLHTCGTETVHIRGWRWLDNDWVNFACALFGVLVALLIYFPSL